MMAAACAGCRGAGEGQGEWEGGQVQLASD